MGKIFDNITKEIMTARAMGNKEKSNALKNLKAKLIEYKTSEQGAKVVNSNGGNIPDEQEINVIKKYVKELQGDVEQYKVAKPELAKESQIEMDYLIEYLPKAATADEINSVIDRYINLNGAIDQKKMGVVIKYIKENLENTDGSLVASLVKSRF